MYFETIISKIGIGTTTSNENILEGEREYTINVLSRWTLAYMNLGYPCKGFALNIQAQFSRIKLLNIDTKRQLVCHSTCYELIILAYLCLNRIHVVYNILSMKLELFCAEGGIQ